MAKLSEAGANREEESFCRPGLGCFRADKFGCFKFPEWRTLLPSISKLVTDMGMKKMPVCGKTANPAVIAMHKLFQSYKYDFIDIYFGFCVESPTSLPNFVLRSGLIRSDQGRCYAGFG